MTLDDLRRHVQDSAAIRGSATLQPVGGNGDKVFPPTHSVDEKRLRPDERQGARYARECRRIKGQEHQVVLLDSVQSQANRMEEALHALWRDKEITLPVIDVDFGRNFPDLKGISSLTAPHRVSDALLRDSLLGATLFRHSDLGTSFTDATIRNAAPLFNVCPTGLVFGLWDSTGPKGGLGFKLARNLTSEIVGVDAVFGTKTSSRIDPTGIVRKPLAVLRADAQKAPHEQWTLDEGLAEKADGKAIEYGKKDKAGTTTAINHSNIPPTLDILAGGVTFDKASQTVVLSLAGLRRLSFGQPEEDVAARTVLAALGLLAVVAAADRGYDLRSRCQLIPEQGKALSFEAIAKDGSPSPVMLDLAVAKTLYRDSVHALPGGLRWKNSTGTLLKEGESLARLTPSPKLVRLIEESRKLAGAGEVEDNG